MSGELAGLLKERITLETQVNMPDALGGASGNWRSLGLAWAAVQLSGSGTEHVGDAASALPRYTVTLRPGATFSPGDRIIWRGRTLKVLTVNQDPLTPDRLTCLTEQAR